MLWDTSSSIAARSCSSSLISIISSVEWVNVIFCGISRWSRSFRAVLWQRTGELNSKIVNVYCCLCFMNANSISDSYFLIMIEENTFTKLMVHTIYLKPKYLALAKVSIWHGGCRWASFLVVFVEVIVTLQDPPGFSRGQAEELNANTPKWNSA